MSNFSRGAGIDITAPRITNKFYCQMVQIKTTVKCLEGAPVNVKNYRMKPAKWETGVVMDVEIHVRKDGTTSNVKNGSEVAAERRQNAYRVKHGRHRGKYFVGYYMEFLNID